MRKFTLLRHSGGWYAFRNWEQVWPRVVSALSNRAQSHRAGNRAHQHLPTRQEINSVLGSVRSKIRWSQRQGWSLATAWVQGQSRQQDNRYIYSTAQSRTACPSLSTNGAEPHTWCQGGLRYRRSGPSRTISTVKVLTQPTTFSLVAERLQKSFP